MKVTLASALTLASLATAIPAVSPDPCKAPSGTQVLLYPGFESGNGFTTQNAGGELFYSYIVTPGRKSKHALANTLNSNGEVSVGILTEGIKTCNGAEYTYSIDYKWRQYSEEGSATLAAFVQYGPQGDGPPSVTLPSSNNQGTQGEDGHGVWASQGAVFTAQNNRGPGTLILQFASEQNSNVTVLIDNVSITKN